MEDGVEDRLHLPPSILLAIHCYTSGSNTVKADPRRASVPPPRSGVEELDAVYIPIVAAQINGARLTTGRDSLPDVDFFTTAVGVVNNNALKLDRRAVDSDLNSLEPARRPAHGNPVVIHPSIHIGLSQISPTAICLRRV